MVDLDQLPASDRHRVAGLVDACATTTGKACFPSVGSDLLRLTVDIHEEDGGWSAIFDELSMPKGCLPLIEYLQDFAKRRQSQG
jgi:hypothetical protein